MNNILVYFKNNYTTIFKVVLIVIFIIAVAPFEFENDTFFDIALGEKYISEGTNDGYDTYSIHEGLKYNSHHILSQIIIYSLYKLGGFLLLHIFEVILLLIISVLFYKLNKYFTKDKKLAYSFVYLELFMFMPFISLRAQMFSTIIFLAEILVINNLLRQEKRYIKIVDVAILTILPILLINLHGGVIFFYYIVLGVYLISIIDLKFIRNYTEKSKNTIFLLIPFLISIPLAIFLNPYGINSFTYMFKTLNNSFINENIAEFRPFSLDGAMTFYMLIYYIIHVISIVFSKKKITITEILFLLGTAYMSLTSVRHFIFYVIMSPILTGHIERIIKWVQNKLLEDESYITRKTISKVSSYLLMIFIVIFSSARFITKGYEYIPKDKYPVDATEYIKKNNIQNARFFNEYTWGSYMMLNDVKVYIDSRADLYTSEYNEGINIANDYIDIIHLNMSFDEVVSKYNIQYFLLKKDSFQEKMYKLLDKVEVVYEDSTACILKIK